MGYRFLLFLEKCKELSKKTSSVVPRIGGDKCLKNYLPLVFIIGWVAMQFGDTLRQPALLSDDFFSVKFAYFDFTGWTHLKGFLAPNNSYNNRPFGNLIYAFLFSIFRTEPTPYILVLFALHIANTILVFLLSFRLIKDRFMALICCLIFATFYISANNLYAFPLIFDNLALFWWAMAFLLYIENRHAPSRLRYIGSVVCFLLSTRSKEIGVTLSPCLLLYDFLYRDAPKNNSSFLVTIKDIVKKQFAFHLFALIFLIFYIRGGAYGLHSSQSHPYYIEVSLKAFLDGLRFYLAVMTFGRFGNIGWLATFFMVVIALGLALRQRTVIWGLSTFLITLLPVIFLVNARREYYLYMPSFGLILAVVNIMGDLLMRFWGRLKYLNRAGVYLSLIIVFSLYAVKNGGRLNNIRNYYGSFRASTNTTIRLLKSYHSHIPRGSKLYFISVPPSHILNIDLALLYMPMVIYEDTSLSAVKVENRKVLLERMRKDKDINFYVFEFLSETQSVKSSDLLNWRMIDISEEFTSKDLKW